MAARTLPAALAGAIALALPVLAQAQTLPLREGPGWAA
jgi:hypothetical protein